jgi:transcriptional regulator GlxA family with amidase domain
MIMRKAPHRTIAMLAMPGVQLLDVSGPLDVFAEANVQAAGEVYRLIVIAGAPGEIVSSSGTRLLPDRVISDHSSETIDTFLVAGCPNAAETRPAAAVTAWLQKMAPLARRYGSVWTCEAATR